MTFDYIMGHQKNDTLHTWCILGMDFVKPHASDNAQKTVANWIATHKNATVIPVCSFGPPANMDVTKKLFIFCWIVDGKDTLNNYLVRNGCFPGGVMFAYDQWEERNKTMKGPLPEIHKYVSKKSYEDYKLQIANNERYAYEHKIGLFSAKEYYKIKAIQEGKR